MQVKNKESEIWGLHIFNVGLAALKNSFEVKNEKSRDVKLRGSVFVGYGDIGNWQVATGKLETKSNMTRFALAKFFNDYSIPRPFVYFIIFF